MTDWHVDKNAEAKTMVITAEFKASITNVWQLGWMSSRTSDRHMRERPLDNTSGPSLTCLGAPTGTRSSSRRLSVGDR